MITYSASFEAFLRNSDCKVAQVLNRLKHKRYRYCSNILTDSEIDYITFRNDGTISYLPAGKEHKVNPDTGDWLRDGRQNGKAAKVIRKLFNPRVHKYFKDVDFECFTNQYKAAFSLDGYEFKLLDNRQIPDVYDMDIKDGSGSLNNSCMNGDSSYLDIYKYCKSLSILTYTDKDGLLCGRALVWKISDSITVMDRIYIVKDFMYDAFLTYAKNAGYWTKADYKSYSDKTTFINPQGDRVTKHFTVNTDCSFDEYPYIDTFSYGDSDSLNNYGGGDYTYNETDGTRGGEEDDHEGECYDDLNDEWINDYDSIYIEYGDRQYRGRTTHIDNCVNVNDNWYHVEDSHIVEVDGEWFDKDDDDIVEIDGDYYKKDSDEVCFVEDENEYFLESDCVYSDHHNEWILATNAVEVCGNIFKKDDVVECA